ncbi:hypothetical protein AB2N04_01050 (plasmid) [Nitratireductor sp. GISD-1A_MAKvit]|uniref:hypothetical protein n=1 Tax=Nitratireductor sp. GISD-1A_MAKvit TaxID=3234198 RepID=UPI003466E8A0
MSASASHTRCFRAYSGRVDAVQTFTPSEIDGFILNGIDYVLEGSVHERLGLLRLHRWLRDQQLFALQEISSAIEGRYPAAVGQSLAWGLLDQRTGLNGYKCDIDILLEQENTESLVRDLERRGHYRRVIDAETGALIEVDEDIMEVPDKTLVGSIVIPFSLSQFDPRTQSYILRLAGEHQPLNVPKAGEPYLLYGVDAVHAYGGDPIDMDACTRPHGDLRIQVPEHNATTTLVRLFYSLKLGYLKPNLLLIVPHMLSLVDTTRIVDGTGKHDLLPFLKMYIEYHRHFINEEKYEEYMAQLQNVDATQGVAGFTFDEVYEALESLMADHGK